MNNQTILIVSPSESFSNRAQAVMEKNNCQFDMIQAAGQACIEAIEQKINKDNVSVIITRGYNVTILRERLSIPVVDVRYTFEDIYYSYNAAVALSEKVVCIATDIAKDQVNNFKSITKCNMLIPSIASPKEIYPCIKKLKTEGYDCFIGGMTTENAARSLGVRSIDLFVGESSMETAMNEAVHLVELEKEKEKNQALIKSILEANESGIIAISKNSEIIYINQKAQKFFGDVQSFVNQILSNSITECRQFDMSLINQVITYKNENYILNFSPIKSSLNHDGYLASIERLELLQAKEGDVRNKISKTIASAKRNFDDLIGNSACLQKTIHRAKKFAYTNSAILINGETGTGKELFAQGIHNYSQRKADPFIAINCASLSENVLESELFGYVSGAFTGAMTEGKVGLFEAAHKGTIFLDEIGDISLNFQAKLLRVLQEQEIRRIGDTKSIPIDVRIISATNKDLVSMVEQQKFREDLYYRLCVLHLQLPPLRQRKEDIKDITLSLLNSYNRPVKITASALDFLTRYDYPGNIRQLQNISERLIALSEDSGIDHLLVKNIIENEPHFHGRTGEQKAGSIYEAEKELILRTLLKNNYNKTLTADELKISKSTLWRKLKLYEID